MKFKLAVVAAFIALLFNSSWAATRTPVQTDDFADNNLGAGTITWTQINDCCSHIQNTGGNATSAHSDESAVQANGTYSADQYAKFKIITLPSVSGTGGIGVIVRNSGQLDAARDYYKYWIDGLPGALTSRVTRVTNGTGVDLNSTTGVTWSVNDTIEIEVQGTTIRGYQNGTLRVTVTDSNFSTGKPGIMIWNNVAAADDFEAGDVTTTAATCRRALVGVGC